MSKDRVSDAGSESMIRQISRAVALARLALLVGVSALLTAACVDGRREAGPTSAAIESKSGSGTADPVAARIEADIRELASDGYGGRNGGSEGERRAAQLIAERFRSLGLEPAGDDGSYFQSFSFRPRHPLPGASVLESRNVVARFRGSGLDDDQRAVVIGGHYDGMGRSGEADPGREDSELAKPTDKIWNSADDNASSIAVLLEIARSFARGEFQPARDIVFCAFGAEEHGMPGSFHFVSVADPLPAAMLNLEMPGRWPGEELMTAGFATSPVWPEVIADANDRLSRKTALALDLPEADTDYYPFFLRGVPAMTIGFPDGPLTHTAADEADDLSFDDLSWRGVYIATLLEELSATTPVFSADLSRELPVAVVSAPTESGLALEVVAALAGGGDVVSLEPGDLILEIEGRGIVEEDEWDLHPRYRDLPPDACLPLTVQRSGARRKLCL